MNRLRPHLLVFFNIAVDIFSYDLGNKHKFQRVGRNVYTTVMPGKNEKVTRYEHKGVDKNYYI